VLEVKLIAKIMTTLPYIKSSIVYAEEYKSGKTLIIAPKMMLQHLLDDMTLYGVNNPDAKFINIESFHKIDITKFDRIIMTHYRQYLCTSKYHKSIIKTCKIHNIDVIQYFDRICDNPASLLTLVIMSGIKNPYSVTEEMISNIKNVERYHRFSNSKGVCIRIHTTNEEVNTILKKLKRYPNSSLVHASEIEVQKP